MEEKKLKKEIPLALKSGRLGLKLFHSGGPGWVLGV